MAQHSRWDAPSRFLPATICLRSKKNIDLVMLLSLIEFQWQWTPCFPMVSTAVHCYGVEGLADPHSNRTTAFGFGKKAGKRKVLLSSCPCDYTGGILTRLYTLYSLTLVLNVQTLPTQGCQFSSVLLQRCLLQEAAFFDGRCSCVESIK